MSFLKSLNRKMERNYVVSKALTEFNNQSSITDMDDFSEELWKSISVSSHEHYSLELTDNNDTSLEFIVKLFIKIGFTCEDAVRLMMRIHKNGSIILAKAEEGTLLRLQEYINTQAKKHNCSLANKIIKASRPVSE